MRMYLDEAVTGQSLNGLHVLAVDDLEDVRQFLVVLFEFYGATVTAVASVREALAVLDMEQPSVLVSDISMPDESGYDLIRLIRERSRERGGEIPAIALTALMDSDVHVEILAAGFQAHVAKPVEPDELVRIVKAAADRQ
jgi:CheY-like chemotaxis protein